jgi:hypothetical protein
VNWEGANRTPSPVPVDAAGTTGLGRMSAGLVDYDSDTSGSSDCCSPSDANQTKTKAEVLPSVDEAFRAVEDTKPSFSSKFTAMKSDSAGEVSYQAMSELLKAKADEEAFLREAKKNAAKAEEAAASASSSAVAAAAPPAPALPPQISGVKRPHDSSEQKGGSSGTKEGHVGEKLSFKDRTKRQRLAGQSGIGEDFRSWRTDEEMKERQQYD